MVPKGWELTCLGDIADTTMGYAFKSKDFVKNGIPLIRMGNLYQNKLDLSRSPIFLPREFAADYERFVLKSGDLVMSMTGTMGKRDYGFTVQIPEGTPDSLLNQRVMKFESKANSYLEYLKYLLRSEFFLARLYAFPGGTKQANISALQVREIPTLLPPRPEQQKIAQLLSTWDNAISTTEKLITNSKQQKKALMQQLLTGKKRLVNPETGKTFDGEWEKAKLGDLAEYSKGYTYKSHEYSEKPTEFGFLTLKSILRGGGYSKKGIKYIQNEVNEKFSVTEEDVVFAVTDLTRNADVVGAPILIPKLPYEKTFISMDLLKLELSPSVDKRFFFYLLKLRDNRNFMRARASGSTVLHLDIKGSKKMPLELPCLGEQQKIASVLTDADKEIELLEAKLAHFEQEKKALMQQLLTGKRRVKIAA